MIRWLKFIFSMAGIILLFAVISAILLVIFVSPNRFKPLITEQVKNATGREFLIDGDLSWTFFPYLGVKVGHMALANPPGFNEKIFAEIDHATVSVKLLPLLHAKVESRGVILDRMKLHLIKNGNGKTNWEDLQRPSPAIETQKKKVAQEEKISHEGFNLDVSSVDVNDASISWVDELTKRNANVDHLDLHAKDINLKKSFPFSTSFKVAANNPMLAGSVTISSDINLDMEKQIYTLHNMEISAKINDIDFEIRGNWVTNLDKDTFVLDDFSGQIANVMMTGKLNVIKLTNDPRLSGHVQINPVDMKEFLRKIGQNIANLQTMKNLSGDMDFIINPPLPIVANGRFKIDAVETPKIKMSDVHVDLRFQNNILHLVPLTAKLYQGDLYSQIKVDLNSTPLHYGVSANLSGVQAEPLLQDLAGPQKITLQGTGNIDLQVTTSGNTPDVIQRNLNGSGKLNFNEGVISGVDIGYYIDSAYALVKNQSSSATDNKKTTFGSLSATINIHDGVMSNNDLHFDSPRFATTGKGIVNLVNQQIDYSLQTSVKKISSSQKNNLLNLYGMAIPLRISGNLSDPKIQVDTNALLKAAGQKEFQNLKEKVQEKVEEQLNDKVKEELKGKASDLLNNLLGS